MRSHTRWTLQRSRNQYYIWAYVTYFVGTNLFDGTADAGELLRVLGYASGPRVLGVLGFIPCVGGLAGLVGAIWALVAGVIAVREALDLTRRRPFSPSSSGGRLSLPSAWSSASCLELAQSAWVRWARCSAGASDLPASDTV